MLGDFFLLQRLQFAYYIYSLTFYSAVLRPSIPRVVEDTLSKSEPEISTIFSLRMRVIGRIHNEGKQLFSCCIFLIQMQLVLDKIQKFHIFSGLRNDSFVHVTADCPGIEKLTITHYLQNFDHMLYKFIQMITKI